MTMMGLLGDDVACPCGCIKNAPLLGVCMKSRLVSSSLHSSLLAGGLWRVRMLWVPEPTSVFHKKISSTTLLAPHGKTFQMHCSIQSRKINPALARGAEI